jgi:hypothetical protein
VRGLCVNVLDIVGLAMYPTIVPRTTTIAFPLGKRAFLESIAFGGEFVTEGAPDFCGVGIDPGNVVNAQGCFSARHHSPPCES